MIPEHGTSFSLLLCHCALLVFVVVFFFLLHHRSLPFWANRDFFFSFARDRLRVELELRNDFAPVY